MAAAAAPGGIIIEYGILSGEPAPFPVMPVVGKGLSIRGYTLSEILRNTDASDKAKIFILEKLAIGQFIPKIATTFPLEDVINAYKYVERNEGIGRVIITMK